MVKAILIDLDGTLLDTAPDLAAAANAMLGELGRPPRSVDEVKTYIGKGISKLVERCLTGDLTELEKALEIYSRSITRRTPGRLLPSTPVSSKAWKRCAD